MRPLVPPSLLGQAVLSGRQKLRAAAVGALVLAALVLSLAGPSARAHGSSEGGDRPNFVVLMTDDETSGEMPVMKATLAEIAAQGVSFDRFVNSFPLCCPSRATFLTGQYSHNNGVFGNGTPIGGYAALDRLDTLPVWLRRAGYYTIEVGKYLNGYPLAGREAEIPPGWDDWHGALDTTDDGENQYFDYRLNENGTLRSFGGAPTDYRTDVYADRAVSAIEARAALGASGRPFFMFVAFSAPHLPATPAPADRGRFRHLPLPPSQSFDEADTSDKPRLIRRRPPFSRSKKRWIVSNFRHAEESLLSVDRAVGRIVRALRDGGMLDDTYVIFLSDQGFFFGEHRLAKGKYLPYEESIRAPMMMRGPGIPAGAHSQALVANVDTAPTILGLAGATPSVALDGRSLLPYAMYPRRRSDRPILLEANSADRNSLGIPYVGILTNRYKLIRYRDGERELYDLARDPHELVSRARDPRYRRTRRALLAKLGALRRCAGASCRVSTGHIPGARG